MIFNYFKKTGENTYDGCWDGDQGYYFDYEVNDYDVMDKIEEIIADDRDLISPLVPQECRAYLAKKIVNRLRDTDTLEAWADYYFDELYDAFEDEAMENVED